MYYWVVFVENITTNTNTDSIEKGQMSIQIGNPVCLCSIYRPNHQWHNILLSFRWNRTKYTPWFIAVWMCLFANGWEGGGADRSIQVHVWVQVYTVKEFYDLSYAHLNAYAFVLCPSPTSYHTLCGPSHTLSQRYSKFCNEPFNVTSPRYGTGNNREWGLHCSAAPRARLTVYKVDKHSLKTHHDP